ncbi:hypothetical protein J4221_04830 [Candidatus Pacearchaeota archaeon]|nr:hypothetical protein [Candidatus Pacearchaeota archaeon]
MAKKSKKKKIEILETKRTKEIELLKSIVEELVNKQAVPLIDLLSEKKAVNEFSIAEKLGLTINQTRNILYKLSDFGLVSFTRKKDKRKGWYIYFWTLNSYQSLILLKDKLEKKLEELKNQLKVRRETRFYVCNTCSIEVDEETALINNFTCPECEGVYTLSKNDELIKESGKNIDKLKAEIHLVDGEIKKYQEKIDKSKERKIKKEEKDKKKKRELSRETKKLELKKALKKSEKEKRIKSEKKKIVKKKTKRNKKRKNKKKKI